MNKNRLLLLVGLIAVAVLTRFLPHPPNFVPVTAIALFAGAFFTDRRWAIAVPLAALFISDAIIGFHSTMLFVYGSVLLIVMLGTLLRNKRSALRIAGTTLAGAVLFFIVTNFGVWLTGTMYPKTFDGLMSCYVAAIPFFRNALLGDAVYVTSLFGALALAERWLPSVRRESVPTV
jgi:hypothetical protein